MYGGIHIGNPSLQGVPRNERAVTVSAEENMTAITDLAKADRRVM